MRVLSLFDGMSCGQIALRDMGVTPEVYYASEVDRHAIGQTQLNFPDTVQLGDVRGVDATKLGRIDLLIGGSPCQSFSFAGKRNGMSTFTEEVLTLERYLELKAEGVEFEGQSYLFWEYARILRDVRETNPDVLFLLENVEMGKKWEPVLSGTLGLWPVHVNSRLVSAQSRPRVYWTNIRTRREGLFGELRTDIPQPADRDIHVGDILEENPDGKYFLSERMTRWILGHSARRGKELNILDGGSDKAPCLTVSAQVKGNAETSYVFAARGREACLASRRTEYGKAIRKAYERHEVTEKRKNMQRVEPRADGKTNCLTTVTKDNLLACLNGRIRKLTPLECSRLQTIPDWYRWECSDTQAYRMLGNGWTVEVIKHIFSYCPEILNEIKT